MSLETATVRDILNNIKLGNCTKAVQVVKEGMAQSFGEVTLLAGSMYEEGLCVRKDWAKAVELYLLAQQQGISRGTLKLIAGYALPENGPDIASALWFAQSTAMSPEACRVPKEIHGDPDRFVALLNSWPKAKLEACNFSTGVLSGVAGALEYPALALAHHLTGKLVITFVATKAEFDLQLSGVDAVRAYGRVDGDMLRDQKTSYVSNSFKREVLDVGAKMLKRYPRPPQVDDDMNNKVQFIFTLQDP